MKIEVVLSETPELIPPKTPPKQIGVSLASQIMISSRERDLSTPSKVVNFVPSANVFTMILFPVIF